MFLRVLTATPSGAQTATLASLLHRIQPSPEITRVCLVFDSKDMLDLGNLLFLCYLVVLEGSLLIMCCATLQAWYDSLSSLSKKAVNPAFPAMKSKRPKTT